MSAAARPATAAGLIQIGEEVRTVARFTREQIAEFARITEDSNPLHHDLQAAQRARFGEIIASGQHTASRLMGLVASHFSIPVAGRTRHVLCLNFNFAFKAPVFADQEIELHWRVSAVDANPRRGGCIGHLDGQARIGSRVCVVGRGTLLVTDPDGERS